MLKSKIIIPLNMRKEILDKIHEGHLGISKCRSRASQIVWWPGISNDIKNMIERRDNCIKERKNYKEPLTPTKFPNKPWEKLGIDLMKCKNFWYVVIIDYYSRFIETQQIKSLTSETIINYLKNVFSKHSIPEILVSDNGPQFQKINTSIFSKFSHEYGFKHITSSPMFPHSNGMAEAAVKIIKNGLKKEKDLNKFLMAYRSSPLENGYSSAELLFNRKIRTNIPTHPNNLFLVIPNLVKEKETERKSKQKIYYDRRHKIKTLPELKEGDKVWITDKKESGKVIKKADEPKSYIIQTENGNLFLN